MAMSDYSPSFYDTGASRRDQERRGSYGGLGEYRAAGAYINPSAFDYGSYRSNSGMVGTLPGPNRTNFRKPHANMTSTDREEMMRMQAQQVQVERQRQVEEKRMREAERKERERLEDQQLEENIRKQQEKMRQEYEEENNRKKKKEAEQIRRREAQLAHLEAARLRAEEEKKKHLAGSHRSDASHGRDLYSRGKSTTEPESSSYRNRFTNAQDEERFGSHQGSSVSGRTRRGRDWPDDQRPARPDADFGLNLGQAAYHTHLSTAFPNRFFDSNYSKKLADRNKERLGRRQSKSGVASDDPEAPSETKTDANRTSEMQTKEEEAKFEPTKTPETQTDQQKTPGEETEGLEPRSDPETPKTQEDELPRSKETQVERPRDSDLQQKDGDGKFDQELSGVERPKTSAVQPETQNSTSEGHKNKSQGSSEDRKDPALKETGVQADIPQDASTSTFHDDISLDWDRKRTEKVATRSRPPSPQFDWKIKVDNLSEEEKNKLNQSSEEEIRNFRDKNTDVMSQLSAMKRDLRTGAGRDGNNRPPSSEPKKDENSGFADTIPAGPGDSDVDYYKVPTAPPSPDNTRKTDRANNRRRAQASSIDLDGTSGTVLRKYLEHTKATLQS
ncbi:uncharacterized protein LOC143038133 isoform X1 [Oratosquilla oratoria]|uniref:uncharacterized protein LOC143038133 isoform X1 n=1 Tax=Oratosquilla oratoria TaxID=337810 RepID=UPI003F75B98B